VRRTRVAYRSGRLRRGSQSFAVFTVILSPVARINLGRYYRRKTHPIPESYLQSSRRLE